MKSSSCCLSTCSGKVVRRWVSRFDIYPYLERYTVDAAGEINRQVCDPCHLSAAWHLTDSGPEVYRIDEGQTSLPVPDDGLLHSMHAQSVSS